jgi:hypothetical protein
VQKTAYFFGAGCSYGTLRLHKDFPPIARDFGPQLAERVGGDLESEYPTLAQVVRHLAKPLNQIGLEELWTCIDYHAKFPATFRTTWEPLGQVIGELQSALLMMYGSRCDTLAKQLSLDGDYTLSNIIKGIKPGDTLISFNWDTLVEHLCQKRGLVLGHRNQPDESVIRFAKPHGSASWNLKSLPADIVDGPPLLTSLDEGYPMRNQGRPLFLGAVPIKSELISEVQMAHGTLRIFDVIRCQWRAVADAVRDADRLVVLGYRFPPEDTYGTFFYEEAMRERKRQRGGELRVDYYARCQDKRDIECLIRKALPGASPIRFKGEVTAPRQ